MPHSLDNSNGMAPQVNGETPSSAFLNHLTSYPLISDSISTFKSNPFGAKSIDLSASGYQKFGKPFIPYFQKPYQYVSPYVAKADELGDSTLSNIDSRFPVVKKPTGELYSDGKSFVFYPLTKGNEGKDYVLSKYNGQVKKTQDQGLVGYGKAVVATGLIVSSDALQWLGSFLSAKKEETKEMANDAKGMANDAKNSAQGIANDAKNNAQGMANEAKKDAKGMANEAKNEAKGMANNAKGMANEAKQTANEKMNY